MKIKKFVSILLAAVLSLSMISCDRGHGEGEPVPDPNDPGLVSEVDPDEGK